MIAIAVAAKGEG